MSDFRLKVFQCVAKNLSFTKASQELFISQPAITKHIHELESNYGAQLFERKGNRITLTAAGRLLLNHCEQILDEYKKLDYEMNLLHNDFVGELRLGASTTIAQYVLPPILAQYIKRYPKVELSLLNGNSRDIEKALQEHRIDLGLVEGTARLPNLKYSKFLDDELVAVVPTHSKLADKDEITPQELINIPLVLREYGSGTLDVFEQALSNHHIKLADLRILMYLGSTESIKMFLQHADCMGIVSVRSIQNELKEGMLQVVEIENMRMMRNFDFVQLQGTEGGLLQQFITYAQQ
jgi:DNA-binding transcriptional LysR family regulator